MVFIRMAFPLSIEEHNAIEERIVQSDELIIAAAVRHNGAIIMVERPLRHGTCLNWLHLYGIKPEDDNHECGFVTSHGRFVGREEAGFLVQQTDQGSPAFPYTERNPKGLLFSEDMWGEFGEVSPDDIF